MLRCKQVAEALADRRYWELPLRKRVGLRLHVGLCVFCGPFHRQVILMQDAVRRFLRHEQEDPPAPDEALTDEAKRKLRDALASARDRKA